MATSMPGDVRDSGSLFNTHPNFFTTVMNIKVPQWGISIKVCHDREEVTSVSTNEIPKPKHAPLRSPAIKSENRRTHVDPHTAREFSFWDLMRRNGSELGQSPPPSVSCAHPVDISTTSINCDTSPHPVTFNGDEGSSTEVGGRVKRAEGMCAYVR